MHKRYSIKIAGASGQGVNVLGEVLSRAFKKAGYGTFGYREYPSLIKGGHATFQVDVSEDYINSPSKYTDLLVVLNRQSTNWHLDELKEGAIVLHDIDNPRIFNEEAKIFKEKRIQLIYIPSLGMIKDVSSNELHGNMATMGVVWNLLNLDKSILEESIRSQFKNKPEVIEKNIQCLAIGYEFADFRAPAFKTKITRWRDEDLITNGEKAELHLNLKPEATFDLVPDANFSESITLNGNLALSLGSINAGVRIYYSYPMTPSSSILSYLADMAAKTGMIVKQVEDEITAAAMAIGSNFMGTRALTGTSGGGFDLMTEHLSLAGMIEVPLVVILGQRPGPATGMPTWTAQADLMLAVFSGHGEFARVVIAPSDIEDYFYSIQEAFNISEKYQVPVIVLTDKFMAESTASVNNLDSTLIPVERYLVGDGDLEKLVSKDRYEITESGVSKRWLPGQNAADFNSNSDEHTEEGNVTEDALEAGVMIAKRLRKLETIQSELPVDQILSNNPDQIVYECNIVSWGSTGAVVKDAMHVLESHGIKVSLLNLKHLWPLSPVVLSEFLMRDNTILIEGNHNGQLAQLIKMQTGLDVASKLLKWNGRPFFVEDIADLILSFVK